MKTLPYTWRTRMNEPRDSVFLEDRKLRAIQSRKRAFVDSCTGFKEKEGPGQQGPWLGFADIIMRTADRKQLAYPYGDHRTGSGIAARASATFRQLSRPIPNNP